MTTRTVLYIADSGREVGVGASLAGDGVGRGRGQEHLPFFHHTAHICRGGVVKLGKYMKYSTVKKGEKVFDILCRMKYLICFG